MSDEDESWVNVACLYCVNLAHLDHLGIIDTAVSVRTTDLVLDPGEVVLLRSRLI
jgi:hypothetical protein